MDCSWHAWRRAIVIAPGVGRWVTDAATAADASDAASDARLDGRRGLRRRLRRQLMDKESRD